MSLSSPPAALRWALVLRLWLGVFALQLSCETQLSQVSAESLGSLDAPICDSMRAEFLDIGPQYFDDVVFGDYGDEFGQDFIGDAGNNITETKIEEGGFKGWQRFGGNYWCDNEAHGTSSLCRYMTGASLGNNQSVCGLGVGSD
jgi:hypothetical protein